VFAQEVQVYDFLTTIQFIVIMVI